MCPLRAPLLVSQRQTTSLGPPRANEVWVRGWDTHLAAFGILPCFQRLARKPHQYWRFLRSRILKLFQLFRINSTNFGLNQTPKTPNPSSELSCSDSARPNQAGSVLQDCEREPSELRPSQGDGGRVSSFFFTSGADFESGASSRYFV